MFPTSKPMPESAVTSLKLDGSGGGVGGGGAGGVVGSTGGGGLVLPPPPPPQPSIDAMQTSETNNARTPPALPVRVWLLLLQTNCTLVPERLLEQLDGVKARE